MSITSASSAARSGDTARLLSYASRRSSAACTSSTATSRSAACSSRCRRRARSSTSATRNTLTGASGNTTVPMSRPSTTPPPWLPHPLALVLDQEVTHGRVRRHRRHRGRDLRPADLRADVAPVEQGLAVLQFDDDGLRDAQTRGFVRGRDAGLEHRERDRPVHRAGVEHRQPERVGDRARHRRLPRARRPVDRDDPTGRGASSDVVERAVHGRVSAARSAANSG